MLDRQILHQNMNHLITELNPTCHLLALLGAHDIFHASRVTVNSAFKGLIYPSSGTSTTQSQAPEDGYINVRNMLST